MTNKKERERRDSESSISSSSTTNTQASTPHVGLRAKDHFKKSEKVLTWFIDYMYQSIRTPDIKVDPFDSMVLKAHYNFTAHLLFTLFIFVTSHWLVEEPIVCVDQYDKTEPAEDLLELCLTYPYVEFPLNKDRNNMKRRYALYYKWVHIVCLILSFVYKGVLVPRKIFHFRKHRQMLENISEAKLQDRLLIAKRYFLSYKGCHNNMYARFIYTHLSALVVNAVCFFALNIAFQNYYWDLPTNLFIKRDPHTFHDSFSLIFPPFAECEITDVHHILVGRSKWFGCHLTLMEFYEKIFMIFWFWQVFLFFWTLVFILYHVPITFYFKWKRFLLSDSRFNKYEPYSICAQNLGKDDSFALRSVCDLMLGSDYAKLIALMNKIRKEKQIADPNETVYFENVSFNKDSMKDSNITQYHSCKENDKSHPLIGFEHLGASPELQPKFQSLSSSSTNLNDHETDSLHQSFGTWKRCLSLDFKDFRDEDILKRATNLDAKVSPIFQFLEHSKNDSSEDSDINFSSFKGRNNFQSISPFPRSAKYFESYLGGQKKCSTPEYEKDSECTLPIENAKSNFARHIGNNLYMYDKNETGTKNSDKNSDSKDSNTKNSTLDLCNKNSAAEASNKNCTKSNLVKKENNAAPSSRTESTKTSSKLTNKRSAKSATSTDRSNKNVDKYRNEDKDSCYN